MTDCLIDRLINKFALLSPDTLTMTTHSKAYLIFSSVAGFSSNSAASMSADVHPSVYSRTKRCLDILGALVGLTLTALIFLPIAIAIYLDNPGPILYSQTRCGWRGRQFRIWKFRSMVVNAEQLKHTVQNQANGHVFKNDNDPRITRVGRFLRRTSLDELPQFWNVLLGDMSLVGTRPPTVDEVKKYNNRHWQRLEVKPGITGEWQANGRSSISDFEQIVDMDLRYMYNWSIAYDVKLILKTIQVVLHRKGAC
ncbi:MAG: sugar transferase [Leptolyngbya sp. IPPAS B-1204]